jgi:DNA-binding transcriptional regulator YiaG
MKYTSKYRPLFEHLRNAHTDEVTLFFAEIERLMGVPLPASAHSRGWWSNRGRGSLQAAAWLDAGYRVHDIDVDGQRVTFRRLQRQYTVRRVGDTIMWDSELVHALRDHMGVSQSQLAEILGVRQQTVSEWENDVYAPTRASSKFLTLVAERAGFTFGEATTAPASISNQTET